MVMVIFGTVSEELDKAEIGCHGLVIVLGKAYNCFTWKMNIAFKSRGLSKTKETCLSALTLG